jgi:transketolase
LIYSLLHLAGYDVSMEEIMNFRQWGAKTPGHPECGVTPGVEATTGPLGQGTGNAVGMAVAERVLANRFNRPGHEIVDHHSFALITDGDIMEGISAEACSLAGHLKLGKLIFLYDSNDVSLDGPASLAFSTEDVEARYEAYGWQVLHVRDGDTDLEALDGAITEAKADESRPSIIIVKTTLGYGAPSVQGKAKAHGAPLGDEEVARAKEFYGWDPGKKFFVPKEVRSRFAEAASSSRELHEDWGVRFEAWASAFPELGAEWKLRMTGSLPEGWDADLPRWEAGESLATREASGKLLNALAAKLPWLMGGDADLSSSTKSAIAGGGDFDGQTGAGRNLHFGVREHAMGAVVNGMAYHGGVRAYASTFFVFSDYMRPAVRLAAMNHLPEDGPTHQPVEQLMSLRAMPGLHVFRPADANETAGAWRFAIEHGTGPVALVLTRQKVPTLPSGSDGPGPARGAYVLRDPESAPPRALILASGAEVHTGLAAQELLSKEGIAVRVVSMPCWELFEAQDQGYRDEVLPPAISARVSVEAGVTLGWERWIGLGGVAVGVDRFGASAPADELLKRYGITPEAVADAVKQALS